MRRRWFLRTGVLAGLGLSIGRSRSAVRAEEPAASTGGPHLISTWNFGVAANREAVRVLEAGGSALDAVERGVMVPEADPRITSVGYGGRPNRDGVVELDAAIMDGNSLEAGSVAALRGIRHPVAVARRVMDATPHVLLVGEGARRFALRQGFRKQKLVTREVRDVWNGKEPDGESETTRDHDTIGMLALDGAGRLAAACTTSGLSGKLPGRVGDSPLIGHGLYCDAQAGGAAATGIGEEVIKVCGSYQVVEFMREGVSPTESIRRVLERIVRRDPHNRSRLIAFVALRSDGRVGYGSTVPGFQAAVFRDGRHDLVDVSVFAG